MTQLKLTPAERLLQELGVAEPEEIDLEAIAFHLGASVRFRKLDGCEARIIGCNDAGIITIGEDCSYLVILANFATEIAGGFGEFRQRIGREREVARDLAVAVEIANPASGEHPGVFAGLPARAGGKDAASNFKRMRIKLEDIQAAEELAVGIEELVIVDFVMFAEDPLARRLEVGLCGPAFDFIAQCVLALIGVGKKGVVEQEHARRPEAGRPKRAEK